MFFKNNKEPNRNEFFTKVAALLIHAAKIDENFSKKEGEIIKQALIKIGAKKDEIEKIINEGKIIEENSNQILNFTREVKNMNEKDKIKIIESSWRIIYSNKDADIYETNLMRRIAGLLYVDSKIMGDIKKKIENEKSK